MNRGLRSLRHRLVLMRGNDRLRKERWGEAEPLLTQAIRLAPRHRESHDNLAIVFLKLGRWEEAAGVAQRAIDLDPAASDSHAYFGIALLKMERWEEAVAAYRRGIEADPGRCDSRVRLGTALSRLGRWREAMEAYQSALELEPRDHQIHDLLGSALLQSGRNEEAAVAFRRAIELVPDLAVSEGLGGLLIRLANAIGMLDEADEATVATRRAAASDASVSTRLSLAVEFLKLRQWGEAVSELEQVSGLVPEVGGVHFLRVNPLIRLGRFGEAVAAHRQAITAGGEMPRLPGQAASARFEHGNAALWSPDHLNADAFTVERWLEELSTVQDQEGASVPRLLFVLDNDFGELTTVKFFVLGQGLASRATLLLPERLHVHNAEAVPGRTHKYRSVEDILQVVEGQQPDIVFLCSGYLLCEHLGFTPDDLTRLVDRLRERGCRVVTTDPFLGLLSKQDARTLISIDTPTSHAVWSEEELEQIKRPDEERLWAGYSESERILRDTYHLYPSYCDVAEEERTQLDARNVAFFNERLLRPSGPGDVATSGTAGRPHWLFIVAGADCDVQMLFEGEAGFADIVASKLVEAVAAGRHPVMIGSREFLDRLMPRLPTTEGIDLLSYCPFNQFLSLLLSAEHVFYWNGVSHSLLIRLYNQLPIVLFDRGHLLRNAPQIYDRIVAWYYQGWAPPVRDHRTPLTVERVEGWAEDYRQQASILLDRYRRAPGPERVLADLMGRPVTPGLRAKTRDRGEVA